MHQRIGVERTLHPACVRAKDLVGYLARPEALCLLGMFQSHCAMRNQMKKVLKTLCFTFLGRNITLPVEFSNASWKILQGNHLPMTALSKQLRHFVFKDARNRSSEFIQGHEDIIRRSFHADLNLWSFHFCSFQFNEVFEKLRFLLHASQKNLEALVRKQNRNLGFYWKKRYGVLPFSMNTCWKHANLKM